MLSPWGKLPKELSMEWLLVCGDKARMHFGELNVTRTQEAMTYGRAISEGLRKPTTLGGAAVTAVV